jgi:hypothetical protein
MRRLLLAFAVALSFVSVQGHVQRKALGAAALASPRQPSSPLSAVTLGLGTTRAIEKDRHFQELYACRRADLTPHSSGVDAAQVGAEGVPDSCRGAPLLHLRI